MGLTLFEGETIKQPLQLTSRDRQSDTLIRRRPLKPAALQTAVIQPKAVVIPLENPELVPAAIAENKQARRERPIFRTL